MLLGSYQCDLVEYYFNQKPADYQSPCILFNTNFEVYTYTLQMNIKTLIGNESQRVSKHRDFTLKRRGNHQKKPTSEEMQQQEEPADTTDDENIQR